MEKEVDDISEFKEVAIETISNNNIYAVNQEENKDLYGDDKAWKILEQEDKKTDIYLKKMYARFIMAVLGIWEIFVIYFSYTQICIFNSHKVSDVIFVTLLTTATANILVLPTIVLNYLFPKSK